jgi:frataxin-like iron-binding protein CyaY
VNDADFTRLADAVLQLAQAFDESALDCDNGFRSEGVLEVELEPGGKPIVSRHGPAREI